MNNQKKPTQLSHLDYLLNDSTALEQFYIDMLYGDMDTETGHLFMNWLKNHPDLLKEFKELRSTKDLLQTDEIPTPDGMILPSFYQIKSPSKIWLNRLKPFIKIAAILTLFFASAALFNVQIKWTNNSLTFQFGEVNEVNDDINEDQINAIVNKELVSQMPIVSSAIESLIKDELSKTIVEQNERYEQLLLNTMKNQEVVYQSLIQQITEDVSIQRRNDLLQIMQELNNTRQLSSIEIAKNREVINGLIQYAGVSMPEQNKTFNEE